MMEQRRAGGFWREWEGWEEIEGSGFQKRVEDKREGGCRKQWDLKEQRRV
jgi:hypothetical protein